MANLLNVAMIESIQALHAQQWSARRIARELGLDRGTVGKYLRRGSCEAKPANLPTGSAGPKPATFDGLPAGDPKPASNAPTGSHARHGPPSQCAAYHEAIQAKHEVGLSARRIQQDLSDEGITVHYDALRRYLRRLGRSPALPFRRLECVAGEEAQVDFGTGAPLVTESGRRKTHVFRIVLSHSRKGYSEATFTQTTDDFLRALENAFRHFGGVPRTLVIDNLKAAVAHPDWFDPELVPKVQSFCRHYGTVILPTRPYMPRHKGKVEAGIKYVKNNALRGRTFTSLAEQQRHLEHWEQTVADTRIHGTTKQQVGKLFTAERAALVSLPSEPFANFQEGQRKVNRDGHVEVGKAYYSAPPEYLGRTVWVRWDARLVRLFNHRWEQVALHLRREPGGFSTLGEHLAAEKISGLERGAAWLLTKACRIGPHTDKWARAMLASRGIEGTRVLQGLLSLTKKHSTDSIECACETALSHGTFRLRTLRQLLKRSAPRQEPLPFLDEHPIIRPLDDYAAIVARALHRQTDRSSVSEGFTRHGSGVRVGAASSPDAPVAYQGCTTRSTRPRSDYPSAGCSSAEPASVSSDTSSVVPSSPLNQEHAP
ncbi:MAG TPA: IS21 family transposase [Pirellulales bacterium]|nr:IS21 family transposase [Pirellulales bacterium]